MGEDVIVSRSDGGEGAIAQDISNTDIDAEVEPPHLREPGGLPADDVLTGGAGADEFRFETLINAKAADPRASTPTPTASSTTRRSPARSNVHDHWVDGIGNDVVTDFNKDQGDKITITGHTTEVYNIEVKDADGDGAADDTVLHLRSNQGNAGAHHLDQLGTISVLNNKLTADDFTVDANSTAGIVENISQIEEAINPGSAAAMGQWAAAPVPVRRTGTPEGHGGGVQNAGANGNGGHLDRPRWGTMSSRAAAPRTTCRATTATTCCAAAAATTARRRARQRHAAGRPGGDEIVSRSDGGERRDRAGHQQYRHRRREPPDLPEPGWAGRRRRAHRRRRRRRVPLRDADQRQGRHPPQARRRQRRHRLRGRRRREQQRARPLGRRHRQRRHHRLQQGPGRQDHDHGPHHRGLQIIESSMPTATAPPTTRCCTCAPTRATPARTTSTCSARSRCSTTS